MKTAQLIASLAILKVNFDNGHDYIDNFIPFVLEALRTAESPEVSELYLQSAMLEQFGLSIPLGALNIIIRRCYQRKYLKRDRYTFFLDEDRAVDNSRFAETRAAVLGKHRELIKLLRDFVEARFGQKWNEGDSELALAAYLRDYGPRVLGNGLVDGSASKDELMGQGESRYVIKAFARNLKRKSPEFEYLVTLVKGSMLASAVYLPNPADLGGQFGGVEIYLDTPLLIPALGLASNSLKQAARELIEVAYLAGAQLRCFEVTAEELRRVLSFLSSRLGDRDGDRVSGFHDALEYAWRANVKSSDVELIIARLDKLLSDLRIKIVPMPLHKMTTSIDELQFEEVLQERLGYKRKSSLQHDLRALAAIHRLRNGQPAESLDNCCAVFVTGQFAAC